MNFLSEDRLARRVTEAGLNGWPALREVVFDGWLLRFADGYTRRTNSVNLIGAGVLPLNEKVRYCEAVYASQGLPTIVCVPSTADPLLSHVLDERGYHPPADESRVLFMDFKEADFQGTPQRSPDVAVEEGFPGAAWLETVYRLQRLSDRARQAHSRILESLSIPAAFVACRLPDGQIGALAFGAVHDGLVCVNSVVTDPAFRRQGLARKAVSAVLVWAQSRCGATGACLSVVADNAPALALYEALGFSREVYRYHYRRRPG